ncbi:hypothetical protein E4M02_02650 [Brevundimonas sp. S30B]|uniref:hypothetical protein n=1 Tax=unclassified Brevundimonas TaxID=2622653 RepID=UPI00107222D0|nr:MULTISPECIES: hypothetical protein [unclassified Brevundimonas]QBX37211.1 hypothetical protein E4M01_05170 [Brevundimonas sp. MF30-B]TFW03995.1 hypothetical protein E4M02_02650 [Brevundimonas sp. S30B]
MGNLLAAVAGLIWMFSGMILLEIGRLLGPDFDKIKTLHWAWRWLTRSAAIVFFIRGVTLLFPGKLIETSSISFVAPMSAAAVLGVTLALLQWVQADRNPPAWTVQMLRMVALLGRDGPVKFAAMRLPPASMGALPPRDEPQSKRRGRIAILTGAGLLIVAVAAFLAAMSYGPG